MKRFKIRKNEPRYLFDLFPVSVDSSVSSVEMIIKLLTLGGVLALVVEGAKEADDENSDVKPEDATHVQRVLTLGGDKLGLAGVVSWEEQRP